MEIPTQTNLLFNLVTDLELTIVRENNQVRKLAGINGSLQGKKLTQVLPALNTPELDDTMQHCLQLPGNAQRLEVRTGVNGHSRYFTWVVCSQVGINGKPESFQWIGTETTQHRMDNHRQLFDQQLLEMFPDAVTRLDEHLVVTGMNGHAESLYGTSAKEMAGIQLHQYFNITCSNEQSLWANEPANWKGRVHFTNAQGKLKFCDSQLQPVYHNGLLVGYLLVDRDVTAEVESQEKLHAGELMHQMLEGILHESGALGWAVNEEGRYVYQNEQLKNYYGGSANLLQKTIYDLNEPALAKQYLEDTQVNIRDGKIISRIEQGVAANGEPATYRVLKFPVRTSAGAYSVGFACNVTHELNQEKELAYLKDRYEQAASITADVIADWNIPNDQLWRSDPESHVDVHQVKAHSMADRFMRIHPEDLQGFQNSLDAALEGSGKEWTCEYRYQSGKNDNQYKILNEKAVILRNEFRKAVRMVSVVADVTEKRRLELELKEKEKNLIAATLEGQESERVELARELHDNVGQVLAMCKLFVDITADSVQHEYLDKCREHLERAIREIRSLSHRLSPETLDRKGLAGAITDLVDNINQSGKIQVSLSFSEGLHQTELTKVVQTTAYRIVQEMISNMLKHAAASNAHISLKVAGDELYLFVWDDGKGFEPGQVKSGIGLKNIYNRIEVIGGKAQLQTSPGNGCRLNVTLPIGNRI